MSPKRRFRLEDSSIARNKFDPVANANSNCYLSAQDGSRLPKKSVSFIPQIVFGDEVEGFFCFWEVFVKGPKNIRQV